MRKLVPSTLVLFRKGGVGEARIRHAERLQVGGISVATKAPLLRRLTDQTGSQVAEDGDVHFGGRWDLSTVHQVDEGWYYGGL